MKRIPYILQTLLAACIALAACTNEIPYNEQIYSPQLILNAQLNAGEKENYAYLHLSEGNRIGRVSQGSLTLYINGKSAETPEEISPEELYSDLKGTIDDEQFEQLLRNVHFKKFRITSELHPGDRIRLEAIAENGAYHVSAETTVPRPVESLQVDTALAYLREYQGDVLHRRYKITLKDLPGEKNYYRLDIAHELRQQVTYWAYDYDAEGNLTKEQRDTLLTSVPTTKIINREDVILTDGRPHNYNDEENELFPSIENRYNLFTDSRFTDASVTLKVYTPVYENTPPWVFNYIDYHDSQTITVSIYSLNEEQYRYLKALNTMEDDDYDGVLMEAVSIPSNVSGGLGFVGASTCTKFVLQVDE
jgi:hypothetical protein